MNLKPLNRLAMLPPMAHLNSHLWDYEPETPLPCPGVHKSLRISIPIYGIMNLKHFVGIGEVPFI